MTGVVGGGVDRCAEVEVSQRWGDEGREAEEEGSGPFGFDTQRMECGGGEEKDGRDGAVGGIGEGEGSEGGGAGEEGGEEGGDAAQGVAVFEGEVEEIWKVWDDNGFGGVFDV